ncbi:hypothetical protein HYV80_02275 [Candidatus Woesearchaeota archaeon]|nr:hypothetical protein [Candidatus Woesearchaeota archaeon]
MKIKNPYIENLKKGDVSFYAHPIKYKLKDYENVLDKIRRKAKKTKEILSVYTFGHVSVPGISDIDLIFVLKEDSALPGFLRKNYIDRDSNYIVFHPFFIITENIMGNMKYVYPNSDFVKVYGRNIPIIEPSRGELKKIKTCLTTDVILRHFPVDYLYILLSKGLNVRMVLVRLNALSHSFKIFYDVTGLKKPEWENFSKRVDNIRKNWFSLGESAREDEIFTLLKEAVYISLNLVSEFDSFLSKDKRNFTNTQRQTVLFKGNKNRISFVKDWNREDAISGMISHFMEHRNFYSILPISFLKQLCNYSSVNGRLSRYIRKRLDTECMQKKLDPTIKKRIQVLNDQVEYANKLKHSHYPCFFPLGYKTEKGFKNKLILAFIIVTSSSVFRRVIFYIRSIKQKYRQLR